MSHVVLALAVAVAFFCLAVYACLRAASRADDDMDRAYRDWLDDLRAGDGE